MRQEAVTAYDDILYKQNTVPFYHNIRLKLPDINVISHLYAEIKLCSRLPVFTCLL